MTMFASHSAWLIPVAFLPLFRWIYSSLLSGLVEGLQLGRYTDRFDLWAYVLFVSAIAIWYVARSPFDFAVRFQTSFLALFVLGTLMYHVDRLVLWWWTQGTVNRKSKDVRRMLPALLAPPAEELLYRGVLGTLIETASVFEFLVVSAVSFGLLHHKNVHEIAFKTLNGLVYAALFVHTGTIVAPIFAHLGYNCATAAHRMSELSLTNIVSVRHWR